MHQGVTEQQLHSAEPLIFYCIYQGCHRFFSPNDGYHSIIEGIGIVDQNPKKCPNLDGTFLSILHWNGEHGGHWKCRLCDYLDFDY
jgi:hypothetical protein